LVSALRGRFTSVDWMAVTSSQRTPAVAGLLPAKPLAEAQTRQRNGDEVETGTLLFLHYSLLCWELSQVVFHPHGPLLPLVQEARLLH